MAKHPAELDRVFHALADPTRRAVIERLGLRAATTGELASRFDMALPSFSQHMAALDRCCLVTQRNRALVVTYALMPQPLQVAEDWMVAQRDNWQRRLDQLDAYLLNLKEQR